MSQKCQQATGRNGANLDVRAIDGGAGLDRAFMIKPCKRASRLRSERGRSGSCGGSDRHTPVTTEEDVSSSCSYFRGTRRLILDSGLHSLCKCQMLLQDWQCAGYDSFNRPSLRLALL